MPVRKKRQARIIIALQVFQPLYQLLFKQIVHSAAVVMAAEAQIQVAHLRVTALFSAKKIK